MNSFITWVGGKRLLRKEIITRFPEQFDRYIEVFGGAAWILFGKEKHAALEVYNDYNSELVNLFRCVKHHSPELERELSFLLNSREVFEHYKEELSTNGLTDIQRAARFFVLIRISYGAKCANYGCIKRNISNMINHIDATSQRLNNVIIENKDFENLISVYDRPGALFYLDPPYYGTEKYYSVPFTQDDHNRLFNALSNINGKFILSYNNCDYIRDLYKDYHIVEVSRQNNLATRYSNSHTYQEFIITNYPTE